MILAQVGLKDRHEASHAKSRLQDDQNKTDGYQYQIAQLPALPAPIQDYQRKRQQQRRTIDHGQKHANPTGAVLSDYETNSSQGQEQRAKHLTEVVNEVPREHRSEG